MTAPSPLENLYPDVDLPSIQSVFETTHELNVQIQEQNERFARLGQAFEDEPEILELTEAGIAQEQQETFILLSEAAHLHSDVFTAVGNLSLTLSSRAEEAEAETTRIDAEVNAKTAAVEQLKSEHESRERSKFASIIARVEELSPKALAAVEELLSKRLQGTVAIPEILDLEDAILALYEHADVHERNRNAVTEQAAILDELIDTNNSWDMPLALIKVFGGNLRQWALIDELPVEPKLSLKDHERFIELRSRHVDQPEASIYAAFHLIDQAGETVTVDDLANFLYTSEVIKSISDYNLRARVTTLLGTVAGDLLHRILLEEGYVLQYGWRRRLERNGKDEVVVKNRRRIYRALALNDLGVLDSETQDHTTTDGIGISDEFDMTPRIAELLAGRRRQAGTQIDDLGATSDLRSERLPEWGKQFRATVGATLEELEALGLLASEEGEMVKIARVKNPKRVFATEEALRRLSAAGLARAFDNIDRNSILNEVLTPVEMVMLQLFNTHRTLLGKGQPRQDQARKIIEMSVAAYFERRREREKR